MKISGWHGSKKKIVGPFRSTCSSEGCGIYISETKVFASYFGKPYPVEATVKKTLIVDNEDLPALEGNLNSGWFWSFAKNTPWIKANYEAATDCELLDFDRENNFQEYVNILFSCFGASLTAHLQEEGYDSLQIRLMSDRLPDRFRVNPEIEGTEVIWWVVFDPKKVKFLKR